MTTYDVFLSHASADKPKVEALARRLREDGLKPFLDKWHLIPGQPWQEALENALEASRTCAVFLGPGEGPWQHMEMRTALSRLVGDKTFRVIPVLLPGAPALAELPPFLSQLATIECRDGIDQDAYQQLVCGIRGVPPDAGTTTPTKEKRLIWHVPHRRNLAFTGRDGVLKALRGALTREGSAALGQAISGLGGIGKTQTAVEYAYRYRDQYETVVWARAETEEELAGGFAELAGVLELPEKDAREQAVAVEAVRRWMEEHDSWLLVLDNADTPEIVEPFLPMAPRGHVLLTSRARSFGALDIEPIRLQVLAPDDALAFLLKRTGRKDAAALERGAARELAEELGYLPLALEQAGAYIADRGSRLEDYLKSYRKRSLRLLDKGQPRPDYPESVRSGRVRPRVAALPTRAQDLREGAGGRAPRRRSES